jgi:hypothetical protein
VALGRNEVFDADFFTVVHQSFIHPSRYEDVDIESGRRSLRHVDRIVGIDSDAYVQERHLAPSSDGTEVPVVVVRRRDVDLDGAAPLFLYGYGSYEACMDPDFGFDWWRLAAGPLYSRRPERFAGMVAEVPFVDVLTTNGGPVAAADHPRVGRVGNPVDDDDRAVMASYSPVDNPPPVTARPALLVTGAVHDTRVLVREPAKWVAVLKAGNPGHGAGVDPTSAVSRRTVLFRAETGSGAHAGSSGATPNSTTRPRSPPGSSRDSLTNPLLAETESTQSKRSRLHRCGDYDGVSTSGSDESTVVPLQSTVDVTAPCRDPSARGTSVSWADLAGTVTPLHSASRGTARRFHWFPSNIQSKPPAPLTTRATQDVNPQVDVTFHRLTRSGWPETFWTAV